MTKRALIVGGGGQIGGATRAALMEAGWAVVSIGRGSDDARPDPRLKEVDRVTLDRDDQGALGAVVRRGFDAVVDTVAFTPEHASQWAALQDHFGALVVISSGSVYADDQGRTLDEAAVTGAPEYPVPMAESQRRTIPGEQNYSTRKVALEDRLQDQVVRPCTILRPFAIYGIGNRAPREWWFVTRVLQGATQIPLAFGGHSRFHTSASENIAALCQVALESGKSHVLNIADPQCLTVEEIGKVLLTAMGSSVALTPFEGPPKGYLGRTPWSVASALVADMSAAEAMGYRPVTTFAESAKAICQDLLARVQDRHWTEAFPGLQPYPAAMFSKDSDLFRGDRFNPTA